MKRILALVIVLSFFLTGCNIREKAEFDINIREKVETDIDKYESICNEVENASVLMPDLDEIGDYNEVKFTYKIYCYSFFIGFVSDGIGLWAQYDESDYEEEKERVLSSYEFLEEPIIDSRGLYELPVTEFAYKGYDTKIVPDEDYIDFGACKSFLMIGFNDNEYAICYLYYYDIDIDYLYDEETDDYTPEERMVDLVDTAFEWVEFD